MRLTIHFLLLLTPLFSFSQNKVKSKSTIKSVTTYLSGASIHREASTSLKVGKNTIIIPSLSRNLNTQSLQIASSGEVRIVSITSEAKKNTYFADSLSLYTDSVVFVTDQLNIIKNRIDNYNQEKKLLIANQNRIGTDGGVKIDQLELATNFYRTRTEDISLKILEANKNLQLENQNLQRVNRLKQTYQRKVNTQVIDVKVNIVSAKQQTVRLDINYIVNNAGWHPIYNIRSKSIEEDLTLEYNAQIFNNTNEDWNNINLNLSTGEPLKSLNQPTLETWTLNYYNKNDYQGYTANSYKKKGSVSRSVSAEKEMVEDYEVNNEISVNDVAVNFKIDGKQTILADNKTNFIEITKSTLPANYKYYTVPKKEQAAFLLAHITDWEKLNLMNAKANIFYAGSYVGSTFIDLNASVDTIKVSLGRDPKIIVERAKLEDKNKKKMIGTNKRVNLAYELSIKNTHNKPISIEVVDQIPISQENDIVVSVEEISGAKKDNYTGRLLWDLNLEENTTKRINIAFEVKYPKNKTVHIRKSRKVYQNAERFW